MTGAVARSVDEELEAAAARLAELKGQRAVEEEAIPRLANWIEGQAGGGPHPRRAELNERRTRLAALRSAESLQERIVAERRVAASAARCDARAAEYARLVDQHLAAAVALSATVVEAQRFIDAVTDGGRFLFTLPEKVFFVDLGDLDNPTSALRFLLKTAREAGFPLPDPTTYGFDAPAELYPKGASARGVRRAVRT